MIKYYTGHYTPVYTCIQDARKDYDLVTSGHYLQNLLIVVFYYEFFVLLYLGTKRNKCAINVIFSISNGVRQGGIFSPKLFAVYMNGFTDELSNSNGGKCVNYIMYVDDICPMALQCSI